MTLLADLAAVSRRVSGTASRLAKIRELAGCLRRLTPDEIPIAIAFLTSETRQGWLTNLHLGARDPAGGYVMLGKTFKGLTDEMLKWQTEEFLKREARRDGHIVYLKPEIVVEVAFNEVR